VWKHVLLKNEIASLPLRYALGFGWFAMTKKALSLQGEVARNEVTKQSPGDDISTLNSEEAKR
jgi:hypothetical protein